MSPDELLYQLLDQITDDMPGIAAGTALQLEESMLTGGPVPDLALLFEASTSVLILELCRLIQIDAENDPIARDARKHLGEQTC